MSDTAPYTAPDTTSRHSRSWTSKSNENFIEEIKNDEKNINSEKFKKYFGYQNSWVSAWDLFKANHVKNYQILKETIDSINVSRKAVIKKKFQKTRIQIK